MLNERLKQARVARGMSLRELAEAAGGITAQAISNYETGKDMPGSSVLMRLADALGVRLDFFFRTTSVALGEPAYRAHCKVRKTDLRVIESTAIEELERYADAESLVFPDGGPRLSLPAGLGDEVTCIDDVESRAESLRAHWGIGSDAIDNLTELLEDNGIKVIFVDASEDFAGCSYHATDAAVIVANSGIPGDRLRFTLAHELGHIALNVPATWTHREIESAAHRFAGAFLVPAVAARRELGSSRPTVSLVELMSLKAKYGMSPQAWIYRAADLGIITKRSAEGLFRRLSALGLLKQEVGSALPKERSSRLLRLVARATADGIISEVRAAELLAVPLEQCEKLFRELCD